MRWTCFGTHLDLVMADQENLVEAEEELQVGDFDPNTYEHVLPEGAHDFSDFDSDYEENQESGD